MTNLVGTVTQTDAAQAVREHRRRIRALEANQPGSQDGAWVTPLLLAGTDASTLDYPDAPVAYRQTNDGMIVMRGRVVAFSAASAVLFALPTSLAPAYDMWFVCDASGPAPLDGSGGANAGGSASGFVRVAGVGAIDAGHVVGYLGGRGFAWVSYDNLDYEAVPLFVNTAGDDYAFSSGFEIVSGHSVGSPPPGVVFYASGEYADGELTVTAAAATELMLGARLQLAQVFASSGNLTAVPVAATTGYQRWTPGSGDLYPTGGLAYPPGFWLHAYPTPGDDWLLYHADPLLDDPVAGLQTVATFPGPGYASGDTITLRVQGAGSFAVLKNGAAVWADRFAEGDDGTGPTAGTFSSGWFGLGAQGAASTSLVSPATFGPSGADGVSLTNVRYRTP